MTRITRFYTTAALTGLILLFASCGAPAGKGSSSRPESDQPRSEEPVAPSPEEANPSETMEVAPDQRQIAEVELLPPPGHIDTSAHTRYLEDEPEFVSLPDAVLSEAPYYALVASDQGAAHHSYRLTIRTADSPYMPPVASIESDPEPLPIGTILPIFAIYDTPMETNLVQFDGEFNYFYRTEYDGREALVFGADLLPGPGPLMEANEYTALRDSPEVLRRYAYYYSKPRRSDSWTDFNGLRSFSSEALDRLSRDRFTYEEVAPTEYTLAGDRPSDMIALYRQFDDDRGQTIFLSTDLFAHAIHLVFHTALKTVEEYELSPRLATFLDGMIDATGSIAPSDIAEFEPAVRLAREYLMVGRALLGLAPVRDEGSFPVAYEDVDKDTVLAEYPAVVRSEVELILAAAGFADSPILGLREDYSQYRPRGHYTENGVLSAYFRAMMWFGRAHFPISAEAERVMMQEESAAEASTRLLPVVLILEQVVRDNPDLFAQWRALYDPITTLIGESDDLSFYDLEAIADEVDWQDLPRWVTDPGNLEAYAERAASELRSPAIAGNSVFYALSQPSDDPDAPPEIPPGFRLFGQRFTHDSFVHQLVSSPRIMGRMFVAGVDIFDAMGSAAARGLLGSDKAEQDYDEEELAQTLDELRTLLDSDDPAFYYRSYYTAHLGLLRNLARFETGSGLYFTESPAWGLRALTGAHGSWAELRHDTLLYVKQVYAEMGGGDEGPTFRTFPFDRPIHYIEPNRGFFVGAINLLRVLESQELLSGEMIDLRPQIERFEEILTRALEIVDKELRDQPISPEENEFIVSVAEQLVPIVTGTFASPYSFDPPEEYRRALVADVFTNAEVGRVLEVATGIPYRMHVLLNDGDGGKRIATGYGYSYYEFYGPMDQRMTNEEWREIVYDAGGSPERYLPFWAADTALPAGSTTMLPDE